MVVWRIAIPTMLVLSPMQCAAPTSQEPSRTMDPSQDFTFRLDPGDILANRFIDDEAGVVCYVFYRNGTASSCLPLSETKLKR